MDQVAQGLQPVEGGMEMLDEILAGLIGTASSIGLYKTGFAPTINNVYADFDAQKADFTGYAPVALTWSSVVVGSDGVPTAISNDALFTATDSASPNTIAGAYIYTDLGGSPDVRVISAFYPFGSPVSMVSAGKFANVGTFLKSSGFAGYVLATS